MKSDIENLKKRLIYRSQYRGTKEMDKLIGAFVKKNIDNFDVNELNHLEDLLNIDDDTLYKFYNDQNYQINLANNRVIKLFKSFIYR